VSYGHRVAPRFRSAALLAVATLVIAPVAIAGDPASPRDTPERRAATGGPPMWAVEAASRLSIREQVGQVVLGAFDGTRAPRAVARALRQRRLSGVILFGGNVRSPRQLRALSRRLQAAAGGDALISVDQEGGLVRRIPFAAPRPGQPAHGSAARVGRLARKAAADLRSLGVNVNFAPVADVAHGRSSALADRTFRGGTAQVAGKVRAAVNGYRAGRVAATVKHFPGLGAALLNTDDAPVVIRRRASELRRIDLAPFRSAISARVPLIMASHATYTALDPRRLASQSRPVLHDLLRERMKYEGVVVTDALEARAVLRRSSVAVAAERSLVAGADLLLLSRSPSTRPVSRRVVAGATRSRTVRRRLREATARVLVLKRSVGLSIPAPPSPR